MNKLTHDISHPKGSNPFAQICSETKKKFKCSCKDFEDKGSEKLIKYLNDKHEKRKPKLKQREELNLRFPNIHF